MGMESYSITILAKEVMLSKCNGFQKLTGCTDVDLNKIRSILEVVGVELKTENLFVYDECLELFLYEQDNKFQGIEVKGCISWMEEGIKSAYKLLNNFMILYGDCDIYVLGKKINFVSSDELYGLINVEYNDKIGVFNKQYNNMKLKVTCSKFYSNKKYKKRFINRIFHSEK